MRRRLSSLARLSVVSLRTRRRQRKLSTGFPIYSSNSVSVTRLVVRSPLPVVALCPSPEKSPLSTLSQSSTSNTALVNLPSAATRLRNGWRTSRNYSVARSNTASARVRKSMRSTLRRVSLTSSARQHAKRRMLSPSTVCSRDTMSALLLYAAH